MFLLHNYLVFGVSVDEESAWLRTSHLVFVAGKLVVFWTLVIDSKNVKSIVSESHTMNN